MPDRVAVGAGDGEPKRQESTAELPGSGDTPGALNPDVAQALAEVFRNHNAALVRFVAVRIGSTEDAKEIVQEAYARVLALDRPGAISLLAGYLWRIAVNLVIDRRREQALRERSYRSVALLAESREFSAESTSEARERLAVVERAIGELPPRCLEAFVLHVMNGLNLEEVGREMRISGRVARKHLARALEHLQTCLDAAEGTRDAR